MAESRFVVLVEFVRGDSYAIPRREFDFSEVEVLADSESTAHLIAAQMVACRPGIMVTRTFPSC